MYYNLIVYGDCKALNGEPLILDLSRCAREYTDQEIKEKYSELTETKINEIKRFPCIFAYEDSCEQDPKFGLIRDIVTRKDKVKIEYELINLEKFISFKELTEMAFELDIGSWEMNRTHWAIKEVNLAKELLSRDIKLPYWVQMDSKAVDITKHHFDVALSFPGEVRTFVESIVAEIEALIGPNSYFYDNNYLAQLARPNLDTLLQDIYGKRSKLLVLFIGEKYQQKDWCGIEFRAIREILNNREDIRIMLIKMDDGQVDGIKSYDGYIDARKHDAKTIARCIKERIDILRERL
jgi:Uncharacterized protein containing a TIR (Toll-Interleukin 1-resistance) domain